MTPWEMFKAEQASFAKLAGDYDFPIASQPKQRSHGYTKLQTRTWERVVFEGAEEQAPQIIPGGRLALDVLFLSTKPVGDLSNCLKSLEDALNKRAYRDDRQIDWITAGRIYGPQISKDRILVKVRERE